MQPQFQHDCDQCVLLDATDAHDFYFCRGDEGKPVELTATVIVRFGSEGWQYTSGLELAQALEPKKPDHPLVRAMRLARERGFIPAPTDGSA